MTADDQLLFTPEDAATKLRVGRTRMYSILKSGELQSVKLGRSRRITAAALQEFVGRLAQTGEGDGAG
jgi:excisionase family DNA binding protein